MSGVDQSAVVVPADAEGAYVWTPVAVAVYGLLLGYPAAMMLAVKNWRALGMYKEAGRHVLGAFLLTLPFIGLILYSTPRKGRFFAIAMSIATFSYLKEKLRSDIASVGGVVRYRRWYSGLGWALLGFVVFLAFVFVVILALEIAGVPVPE